MQAPLRPHFYAALPITAWHDDIAALIAEHPVVVVAGETGSGKTTQLPKICLELGRRRIAHTQPRRLAARTVAERIAAELDTPLGDLVGYQVRFTRQTSQSTRLKVMTDGVLLAEIGRDRDLRRYDTIIVDEAHERSLNIDFLLGYLKQLLARRSDLRVIITSATIDTDRFAAHFAGVDGTPAPVVEVSGRTYPVEIRYRPLLTDGGPGEVDQNAGIVDAVRELGRSGDGDVLVFLSGEREIRDAADALAGAGLRHTEVLPLFARLSAAEQHRIFASHPGRRVVLATNVAETSLTVPGIRFVVDVGTARISRYSARTKMQRLPIELVSQASADQRAGRCGRVAPGVCIRLYTEEDFVGRPRFTEPEILRTNLASVILQMAAADLGDIASFPFVEAPDAAQVSDGLRLLTELGALHQRGRRRRGGRDSAVVLTRVGEQLARIPVDPRMGRMLLAAQDQGCLREMLVIVSGLSIPDPRERPVEHRERADALHRRFWSPMPALDGGTGVEAAADSAPGPETDRPKAERPKSGRPADDAADVSDFMALLRLWDYLKVSRRTLSGNAFRRRCREEFLHYLRIREWQDLHTQLKQTCRDLDLSLNAAPAGADQVHTAALSGLLSHVGLADIREAEPAKEAGRGGAGKARRRGRRPAREYLGARGTRFAINPGSSAAAAAPPLVMAAEIVETSRAWARTVAAITAEQVEDVGAHLLTRQYSEPHWSARAGAVMAYEQVSLYGVPIVAGRRVGYGRIDPVVAREIFIRSALVEGRWRIRHRFLADNEAVRAQASELEERTRRRDLVVDDDAVYAFYDARIPAEVTSGGHFDAWWKRARQDSPDRLSMTMDDLTVAVPELDDHAFPDTWATAGRQLPVRYRFAPGEPDDGVTVTIGISVVNQIDPAPFSWQVPGLRGELATELVRSLPKTLRRRFVPAPDYAQASLDWLPSHPGSPTESLPAGLGRALRALTGDTVSPTDWRPAAVPPHLQVNFEIVADTKTGSVPDVLGVGRDLETLRRTLGPQVDATWQDVAREYTRRGLTRWDFGPLESELSTTTPAGRRALGYPALVDEGDSVALTVLDTPQRQQWATTAGLRRLVELNTPDPTRWVVGHLGNADKLALGTSPYAGVAVLLADARLGSVGELVRVHQQAPVRDADAFAALCAAVRADNPTLMQRIVALAADIVTRHRAVLGALTGVAESSPAAVADLREQLANLVFAGFLSGTPYDRLTELPRYLQAAQTRLQNLASQPDRDAAGLAAVLRSEDAYAELVAAVPPGPLPVVVANVGWLIEELRVSLFAQGLRTRVPVSETRVAKAIVAARTSLP